MKRIIYIVILICAFTFNLEVKAEWIERDGFFYMKDSLDAIRDFVVSEDGEIIAITKDNQIIKYDFETGDIIKRFKLNLNNIYYSQVSKDKKSSIFINNFNIDKDNPRFFNYDITVINNSNFQTIFKSMQSLPFNDIGESYNNIDSNSIIFIDFNSTLNLLQISIEVSKRDFFKTQNGQHNVSYDIVNGKLFLFEFYQSTNKLMYVEKLNYKAIDFVIDESKKQVYYNCFQSKYNNTLSFDGFFWIKNTLLSYNIANFKSLILKEFENGELPTELKIEDDEVDNRSICNYFSTNKLYKHDINYIMNLSYNKFNNSINYTHLKNSEKGWNFFDSDNYINNTFVNSTYFYSERMLYLLFRFAYQQRYDNYENTIKYFNYTFYNSLNNKFYLDKSNIEQFNLIMQSDLTYNMIKKYSYNIYTHRIEHLELFESKKINKSGGILILIDEKIQLFKNKDLSVISEFGVFSNDTIQYKNKQISLEVFSKLENVKYDWSIYNQDTNYSFKTNSRFLNYIPKESGIYNLNIDIFQNDKKIYTITKEKYLTILENLKIGITTKYENDTLSLNANSIGTDITHSWVLSNGIISNDNFVQVLNPNFEDIRIKYKVSDKISEKNLDTIITFKNVMPNDNIELKYLNANSLPDTLYRFLDLTIDNYRGNILINNAKNDYCTNYFSESQGESYYYHWYSYLSNIHIYRNNKLIDTVEKTEIFGSFRKLIKSPKSFDYKDIINSFNINESSSNTLSYFKSDNEFENNIYHFADLKRSDSKYKYYNFEIEINNNENYLYPTIEFGNKYITPFHYSYSSDSNFCLVIIEENKNRETIKLNYKVNRFVNSFASENSNFCYLLNKDNIDYDLLVFKNNDLQKFDILNINLDTNYKINGVKYLNYKSILVYGKLKENGIENGLLIEINLQTKSINKHKINVIKNIKNIKEINDEIFYIFGDNYGQHEVIFLDKSFKVLKKIKLKEITDEIKDIEYYDNNFYVVSEKVNLNYENNSLESIGFYKNLYTYELSIKPKVDTTSVENMVVANPDILIFPNPSSEKISLDLGSVAVADLVIYDILGNEIMTIPNYTNKGEIDISTIPIGTYTIQVQTSTGSISQRFVKY